MPLLKPFKGPPPGWEGGATPPAWQPKVATADKVGPEGLGPQERSDAFDEEDDRLNEEYSKSERSRVPTSAAAAASSGWSTFGPPAAGTPQPPPPPGPPPKPVKPQKSVVIVTPKELPPSAVNNREPPAPKVAPPVAPPLPPPPEGAGLDAASWRSDDLATTQAQMQAMLETSSDSEADRLMLARPDHGYDKERSCSLPPPSHEGGPEYDKRIHWCTSDRAGHHDFSSSTPNGERYPFCRGCFLPRATYEAVKGPLRKARPSRSSSRRRAAGIGQRMHRLVALTFAFFLFATPAPVRCEADAFGPTDQFTPYDKEGDGPPKGTHKPRVRDEKRGALAWSNTSQRSDAALKWTLLAHSVSDDTGLQSYLKEVQHFLQLAESRQWPLASYAEIDDALCKYQAVQCYREDRHANAGEQLMNGYAYLFPDRKMPEAWRACKAWSRVTIGEEGQPAPDETLAYMEDWLRSHKESAAQIAGMVIPVQTDAYARESEILNLRREDVVDDGVEVALFFGRAHRGESAKTGRNQGVRLDFPHSMDLVRQRVKLAASATTKLFPISSATYQKWWRLAAQQAGTTAPPHSCRHTGPSRDLATGYRNMLQVQRRGRWAAEKSVRRYAKTHAWIAVTKAQPPHVCSRGGELLGMRSSRPKVPRE